MSVARQGRRATRAGGNWPRAGMNLEITFEDGLGTDTSPPAANTLGLVNTAIVPGINGLALDTLVAGYASKIGITADLKTTEGTLHRYFRRTDLSMISYISFTSEVASTDEIYMAILPNTNPTAPNGIFLVVTDGGVPKIQYFKTSIMIDLNYHLLSLVAVPGAYLIYFDGVVISGLTKATDDVAYRGLWVGATELSDIDAFTIGGLRRGGIVGNDGSTVDEFVKMYDTGQTATEIANLYAIIGGEK